jgi:threonine dehydrogenase-like Zn-dependent dehydrogenase
MKAIVKTAAEPGALVWGEWPDPEVRPGQVLVEVQRAGICSTDVAIYDWTYRGRQPVPIPSMLGHEAAGVVTEVGDYVDEVGVGDRVALQVIWGHAHARESLQGFENLDPDWIHIGASRHGGVFAERIAMPADRVVLLPATVHLDDAALLEPLAVAAHAMELVNVRPGDAFAVVGPGPFALLMCGIARAAGASRIVAIGLEGVDERRLEVARATGADTTLLHSSDPAATLDAFFEATGRRGADVVMDCGGTPESTFLTLEIAAPAGRVGVFGFTREAQIEPLRQIVRKGLLLFGVSAAQRKHYGLALKLIETETLRPSKIVSHRLPLEQAEDGLELALRREASKVLLVPDGADGTVLSLDGR